MKKIAGFIIFLFFFVQAQAQSFYNLPAKDVADQTVNIKEYEGKKLLIVIVSTDTTNVLADEMGVFKAKYGDKIEVTGLAIGENDTDSSGIRKAAMYNKLKSKSMVLLEGGNEKTPTPLLQWLSNRNNTHAFFRDVTARGYKFFISETGRVLNVLSPQTPLDAPIVSWIVNTKPQKKKQ